MSYEQFNSFNALKDMKDLWNDVADGFHLPKRFRKSGMSLSAKEDFLRNLGRAIDGLEARLKTRH
jgi:hypothetical protein